MTYDDYQIPAAERIAKLSGCELMSSPTGTGKTTIQCLAHKLRPRGLQVVPTEEIGWGFTKRGFSGWFTSKTLLNRLRDGKVDPSEYDWLMFDEAHHSTDDTHQQIKEFFPHAKARVGITATLYRGTPAETFKLHAEYEHKLHRILTIKDAVSHGFMALPEFHIIPLHGDHECKVQMGEFRASDIDQLVGSKMDDLANLTRDLFGKRRSMMVTLSSMKLMTALSEALNLRGVPNYTVNKDTTYKQRDLAFQAVTDATHVLIQYKVVGEGVDLPIRLMIDSAPTMSPVMFMQRYGRVTRPVKLGESPPEIYVTNHNLLRHGYLFEGLLPPAVLKDYSKTFPGWKPDGKMLARVIGDISSFGRFKAIEIPLLSGELAFGWVIADPTGKSHQYAGVTLPHKEDQYLFRREFVLDNEGKVVYNRSGKWRRVDRIPDVTGYTSVPPFPMTPKQMEWWRNDAPRVGLDGSKDVNNRTFQFLPILLNSRTRLT